MTREAGRFSAGRNRDDPSPRLHVVGGAALLAAVPLGQAQEEPKVPANGDLKVLVQGNNAFAFDLYRQLSKREGNLIFSPYSISTALAMTYAGARGKTAEEMARGLHFSLPQERLHPAFGDLILQGQFAGRSRRT